MWLDIACFPRLYPNKISIHPSSNISYPLPEMLERNAILSSFQNVTNTKKIFLICSALDIKLTEIFIFLACEVCRNCKAIELKSFKNIQIGYRNIFMTALRDNHEIIPILIRLSMACNRKWEGVTENAPITWQYLRQSANPFDLLFQNKHDSIVLNSLWKKMRLCDGNATFSWQRT